MYEHSIRALTNDRMYWERVHTTRCARLVRAQREARVYNPKGSPWPRAVNVHQELVDIAEERIRDYTHAIETLKEARDR